jgi:hypothetical protein
MNWLNYPCPLLWFSFSISSLMDGRSPLSSFSHKTLTGMSKHRAGCSRVRVHSTHLNLAPPRSLPSLGSDTQRAWPGGARWMAIKTRCGWAWGRARSANSAPLPWSTAATTKENEVFFCYSHHWPIVVIRSFVLNNSYYRSKDLWIREEQLTDDINISCCPTVKK